MILIRVNSNDIPKEWLEKAQKLAEDLAKLPTDAERSAFLKNNVIWNEIKTVLLEWSHGKCWYSEAQELVSDYHVDHFRPKNIARTLQGIARPGYWWLAYDWRNYRIAGAICNSPHVGEDGTQGKWDYFPLRDETSAAKSVADLYAEEPYLLDPTSFSDVTLLDFDESGKPLSAAADGSWASIRVRETVRILHLDYPPLEEARRTTWVKCRELIDRTSKILSVGMDKSDPLRRDEKDHLMRELWHMASPKAALSATARACLFKSNYQWARVIAIQAQQDFPDIQS